MAIIITNTQGQAVLAKDISTSRHTLDQIDNAIFDAEHNRAHKAFTYISMADHTQKFIIIAIR